MAVFLTALSSRCFSFSPHVASVRFIFPAGSFSPPLLLWAAVTSLLPAPDERRAGVGSVSAAVVSGIPEPRKPVVPPYKNTAILRGWPRRRISLWEGQLDSSAPIFFALRESLSS